MDSWSDLRNIRGLQNYNLINSGMKRKFLLSLELIQNEIKPKTARNARLLCFEDDVIGTTMLKLSDLTSSL